MADHLVATLEDGGHVEPAGDGLGSPGDSPCLAQDLTDLGHPVAFAWNVIALPLVIGEFVAAIRAVVARRRSGRALA